MTKKLPSKKTAAPNPLSETPASAPKPARKAPARKKVLKDSPSLRSGVAAPVDQDVQAAAAPLSIDYPQAGEVVVSAQYTLRITAPEGTPFVEVSVDGGAWKSCRFAVGHWWFDWSDYGPGPHSLSVRSEQGATERLTRVEYSAQ